MTNDFKMLLGKLMANGIKYNISFDDYDNRALIESIPKFKWRIHDHGADILRFGLFDFCGLRLYYVSEMDDMIKQIIKLEDK